jgi:hypothetical protein
MYHRHTEDDTQPRMNPYRHLAAAAILLGTITPAFAKDKTAPPAKPANQYVAFDTHANEKVSIAAEPCLAPQSCDFFRLPYISHGFIPVRVIITNDGDTALTLDDARMQFLAAGGERLPAADLEELNRRLFTIKSTQGTKIPFIPYPVTIHHAPIDKKITEDDADFGFQGTTVNAHSTLAGYLFYDVKELDDPALKDAQLYIKMIHTLDQKHELFAFTIPFDKWLANPHPQPPKP